MTVFCSPSLVTVVVLIVAAVEAFVPAALQPPSKHILRSSAELDETSRETTKYELLRVIASTPTNSATSKKSTQEIMAIVRDLETQCPSADENVLEKLAGPWELLWTAQDRTSQQVKSLTSWINPLENQSYSNNPNGSETGRANPFLPQPIQDKLEDMGLVTQESDPVRSSQTIDMKRKQVINVVSFNVPFLGKSRKASITVSVDFEPNFQDNRKIDVKFQACRVVVTDSPIDLLIPLGIIGPTGWLRTGYIDETIRITRGHKGSIFVLAKPSANISKR
mmetsp:Transcript_29007/g.42796  ORF Transcript_29007/g.42796 Transcript_29007/m.42796 type:complete len:279 (-) Transcript_29007:31-867(-)